MIIIFLMALVPLEVINTRRRSSSVCPRDAIRLSAGCTDFTCSKSWGVKFIFPDSDVHVTSTMARIKSFGARLKRRRAVLGRHVARSLSSLLYFNIRLLIMRVSGKWRFVVARSQFIAIKRLDDTKIVHHHFPTRYYDSAMHQACPISCRWRDVKMDRRWRNDRLASKISRYPFAVRDA